MAADRRRLAALALLAVVLPGLAAGCARRGAPEVPGTTRPGEEGLRPADLLAPEGADADPAPPVTPDRPFFLDPLV